MQNDDERRLVAFHEASHAVAARACGHSNGAISIAGGAVFAGVARHAAQPFDFDPATVPVELPFVLWPHNVRDGIERRVIVALAGDIGAERFAMPVEGRRPTGVVERVTEEITAQEQAGLTEFFAQSSSEGLTDDDLVWEMCRIAYAGDGDSAARWVMFLGAQAAELLKTYAGTVERLADLLMIETSLSAAAVRQVLE